MNISQEKARIRREIHKKIHAITDRSERDEAVRHQLYDRLCTHTRIFAYVALEDEIDLWPLYQRWKQEGKQVFLAPVSAQESVCQEDFLPLAGEPIITPGRAFSSDGARIGRGGGWYDRLFSRIVDYYSIGVAYECQLVDNIPVGIYDKPVHCIVTPSIGMRV